MRNVIITVMSLLLLFLINHRGCVQINILSNNAAFIKYVQNSSDKEIIFKEPLNDRLKLSVSLGDLQITKELERSKYKSVVFVDKQRLYMQSNLERDNFILNSICKFDHEQSTAYAFERVCCQIELNYRNKTLDQKICKLEVSSTASVCFTQLDVAKKHFDFGNNDEYELALISRVFSSGDAKCTHAPLPGSQLTLGLPQRVVVTQGLQVKWTVTDLSVQFGELEIGVPVDSIEINSRTIFPIRIRSLTPIRRINLECSHGSDLAISAISFEGTTFSGEYGPIKDSHIVQLILQKLDRNTRSNWNSVSGEHLVNLEMKVPSKPGRSNTANKWISCRLRNATFFDSKSVITRRYNDVTPIKAEVKVNVEEFIIIPIFSDKTFFSIFNEITGPVRLQKSDLQLFSVHSTIDGSLVDVTASTDCTAISNSSIRCPSSTIIDEKRTPLKDPNWNILLNMTSWQKLANYPVEVWHAEDWRTVIGDKILNKVANWRYYDDTSNKCQPIYQVTRCQLLARIVQETFDTERVYFGQNNIDEFPLFDLTSHLNVSQIQLSKQIFQTTSRKDLFLFSPISAGVTDVSVVTDAGQKLVVDRVEVRDTPVSVTDLQVTCIHLLNVTQSRNSFNPSFRSITVSAEPSRTKKENCFIKINVVFSDGSVTNLQDFPDFSYKVILSTSDESITVENLDSFVYQPDQHQQAGQFTVKLYGSGKCDGNILIFSKDINLFGTDLKVVEGSKITSTKTALPGLLSSVTQHNTIFTESSKIIADSKDSKGINTDSLFLSMKILICLVGLVILIVILNCIIKFKQRKSVQLLGHSSPYPQNDKMTSSTYSPADITSQGSNPQHPPLLPPPGPLYNASDSSQLDLTVNATPDIFWGLPHSGGTIGRNNHYLFPIGQINAYQNMHIQTRISSPSPHSDSLDYGYLLGNNMPGNLHHSFNYSPDSNLDTDSVITGSSGKNCSQIMMNVPPPCPPLRWTNNDTVCSMYYPCKPSHQSPENTSQNSFPQSHSSSWEIKQKPVVPPSGFSNSSDNVCEKSSGLGSLSSTKPGSDCSKKDSGGSSSPSKTANYSIPQ